MAHDTGVPNGALKEALREAGLTYQQLAVDVRQIGALAGHDLRTNKSAVAHWVRGLEPEPATAAYIAEAISRRVGREVPPTELGFTPRTWTSPTPLLGLGVGPDPVTILRRVGEADIQRRKFLTGAAYCVAAAALPLGTEQAQAYAARTTGPRAGRPELDAVRDMTAAFTAVDERYGGQHGRRAVVQYLTGEVTDLCESRFATEAEHREALGLAANVAYLCGWKAYDAAEHGLAQRYYLQAYTLTREAGDEQHGAWLLRIMAHNGMDIRQPEHTLALAEAALDRVRGRVSPMTEALFAITRARALAAASRGPEAATQIRQAQDLVRRGEEEEVAHWAALWGSPAATVSSHTAKTFRALGDHRNAERHYATSIRKRRGTAGQHRISALTLSAQGEEQAAQGHLEAACGTWGDALTLFSGVRSTRAVDAVRGMRSTLKVFEARGVRVAADLSERARDWELAHA
ncbi:hypothetical protein GR925_27585 [Streptomyces sp. HUCO-GS316]|uniref:hypothetical protein n=1 Tax=Streptomyces sp. HUCO-GS316 TaxID=2692198 RepID=UPI00136C4AC4|nr:hypothetical protein [Streptomyces sp. HUCO-GS316]MXM67089.1 hypothetical protein [Streptomyces sp. HUCO-GS316]